MKFQKHKAPIKYHRIIAQKSHKNLQGCYVYPVSVGIYDMYVRLSSNLWFISSINYSIIHYNVILLYRYDELKAEYDNGLRNDLVLYSLAKFKIYKENTETYGIDCRICTLRRHNIRRKLCRQKTHVTRFARVWGHFASLISLTARYLSNNGPDFVHSLQRRCNYQLLQHAFGCCQNWNTLAVSHVIKKLFYVPLFTLAIYIKVKSNISIWELAAIMVCCISEWGSL